MREAKIEARGRTSRFASGWRPILYFLALSFAPTWLLWAFLDVLHVTPGDTVRFALFGTAAMYFPGIAALIVRAWESDLNRTTALSLGRGRFYWLAWFLFPSLIAATIAIDLATGAARADWTLGQLRTILVSTGGQPPPNLPRFAIAQLLFAIAIGPLLHGITTIGEELGWRDFLLPKLIDAGLSQKTAIVATGAVWGLWHIPVILLGLEYVSHPYLGIPMFVGYAILVGTILGWLQLASGSVWVPALAHGSINAVQRAALVFIVGYNPIIGGPLGSLLGWIPLIVFIYWLMASNRLPVKSPKQLSN